MSTPFDPNVIDLDALSNFQLEMLLDYNDSVEHPEGCEVGEIIESQLEIQEGGFEPLSDDELHSAAVEAAWEEDDPIDAIESPFSAPHYPCACCGALHDGLCPAEEDWIAFSEATL